MTAMHPSERKVRAIIAAEVAQVPNATLSWGGSDRVGEVVIRLGASVETVIFLRRYRRHDIPSLIGRVRLAIERCA